MSKLIDELVKALEAGNYNAKPTKLIQSHNPNCACIDCMVMFGPLDCGCDEQGPSFKCQAEGLWHCAQLPSEDE